MTWKPSGSAMVVVELARTIREREEGNLGRGRGGLREKPKEWCRARREERGRKGRQQQGEGEGEGEEEGGGRKA